MKSTLLFTILSVTLLSTQQTLTTATTLFNPFSEPVRPSLLNAFAVRGGTISLHRDEYGFYAPVDLASHLSDASDNIPSPDTVKMQIGLYTSKSLLTDNCLAFSNYTCGPQDCNPFPGTDTNVTYLQFTAQGYEASLLMYLDYSHWYLQNYALVSNSCESNANKTFGNTRSGIIGLGVQGSSAYNFVSSSTFSVSIDPKLWSGQLVFRNNIDKIYVHGTKHNITCDQNWFMHPNATDKITIRNSSISLMQARGIFDIGSDTMGFPQALYENLITLFEHENKATCDKSLIKPNCSYNGSIKALPNITIHLQGNPINLTSDIYVKDGSNITTNVTSVVLNFKAISPNLTGDNYVTDYYKNAIIFDLNVASFYFILFNTTLTQNKIVFIEGHWNTTGWGGGGGGKGGSPIGPPTPFKSYVLFIIIGVVIFAAIVGFCYYIRKKKRSPKRKGRYARVGQNGPVEPLLVNKDSSEVTEAQLGSA